MIKIFFFGTHNFAASVLDKIIASDILCVSGVVTAPDKQVGREQAIQKSAVKNVAEKFGIPIYQPENLKNFLPDDLSLADLGIVVEYGKIIPINILNAPKHKTVNIHGSLLPKYRGASPIQSAILNGEKTTGVTLMLMDAKMDHGPILKKAEIPIEPDEIKDNLSIRLSQIASELVISAIPEYIAGKIKPVEQQHDSATYCKILTREDGKIDFSKKTASQIYNQFRALTPWPGIWCFAGNKRLKLIKISLSNKPAQQAKILFDNSEIIIGCAENTAIKAEILQLEGKKTVSARDFINGNFNLSGSTLN